MKGFALDSNGDLIIENGLIQTVNDEELIKQTVRQILKTNINEWFLNLDEGITFGNLLGREQSEELIRSEIEQGLSQVDSTFFIEEFSCEFDNQTRKLSVKFTAKNENGDIVEEVSEWA